MRHDGSPRWPYLSPTGPGWHWVDWPSNEIRRVIRAAGAEPDPDGDPLPLVLDTIEHFGHALRAVEKDVLLLVTEAYSLGASWGEIARRLDRAKQTVHQRYQPRVHAEQTRDILRADLAEAIRQAQQMCRGPDGDVALRARAFLREQAVRRRRPTGPSAGSAPAR